MRCRIFFILLLVSVSGCTGSLKGDVYSRGDARKIQQVKLGEVVAIREVAIEGRRSAVGELGGAVIGGIAGGSVGKGRGKSIMTTIGVIVGGIIGSNIEEAATSANGIELTIKLDNGNAIVVVQEKGQEEFRVGAKVKIVSVNGNSRVSLL
ncbi:MAG: glycine zipper 2TM domain-containing protein [Gammaproteobacteria bacterium]|nr:MAG: glycine zipper 2TM domain-containing protein [Gammaproteobacteria bacterium]